MRRIEQLWYSDRRAAMLLLPLAWLYCAVMWLRRLWYRTHTTRVPAPVIVIGNLTVGGTGKTPLAIWLARLLLSAGFRPGIATRGYGGHAQTWPQTVCADSDVRAVGEESVLIARRAGVPVVADPDRVRAAQHLIVMHGCNVIVCDDGLQHLALARDIEIAVIDGDRRFGNGYCLPAGPLREPVSRLRNVDVVITNGQALADEWGMTLAERGFFRVGSSESLLPVDAFRGRTVHAVAGIGNPSRFFGQLKQLGAHVIEHPFPDHHWFQPAQLRFPGDHDLIMTEKDAVKCERFTLDRAWYLAVEAQPDERLGAWVLNRLKESVRG